MQEQLDILDKYQVNKIENVLNKLGMEYNVSEILNIKYKKYAILGRVEVTTEKVVDILSEVVVYKELFNRMEKGIAKHQDWLVLLGTLAPCDADASLLKSVLQRFPNYDEEKTLKNVEILKDKYFPATFRYLYQIYKLDMEKGINPNETGLLYLLKRIGMEQSIIEQYEAFNEIQSLSNINVTIDKEKNYLKENDEVPNVIEWNYLNTLKLYDLQYFQEEFEDIVYGNKKKPELAKYDIYYRVESVSKIRELVSLSGKDRVITTHLALKLCDLLKGNWKSYSYHVSLISKDQIFIRGIRHGGDLLTNYVYFLNCHSWIIIMCFI